MDSLHIILPTLCLILIFTLIILFHYKKKSVMKKVNSLSTAEKDALLDTLAAPVGYGYDSRQDLFIARKDAPQKIFGYNTLFDLSAPYFNMIFDYETIYFDYNGRTWLIEMWKGQYGINTGCELGIYYADKPVSPQNYKTTHFESVSGKDMLDISLELNRIPVYKSPYHTIGREQNHHWWLTMFKMGRFTKPDDLLVNTSIRFKDRYMMYSFLQSFEKTMPSVPYHIHNLTVYFSFFQSNRSYTPFQKLVRRTALTFCHIYCILFNRLTKPFENTGDKLLYLYYYLPFAIRMIFRPKKKK